MPIAWETVSVRESTCALYLHEQGRRGATAIHVTRGPVTFGPRLQEPRLLMLNNHTLSFEFFLCSLCNPHTEVYLGRQDSIIEDRLWFVGRCSRSTASTYAPPAAGAVFGGAVTGKV